MNERIESMIKDLVSSLQIARLYTVNHQRFVKFIDKAYDTLVLALEGRSEIVIGIIEGELSFENEIFFDLSKSLLPIITYLNDRGIEKITIKAGVEKEELTKFMGFLALPKDEAKAGYFDKLPGLGVKNLSVSSLKSSPVLSGQERAKLSEFYGSVEIISQAIESMSEGKGIDNISLKFIMTDIIEDIEKSSNELLKLSTVKRYDPSTFIHSLNVSILSMFFSSKLGFTKNDILDIGIAALFHDIGKLYISRNIIRKRSRLTDEEFEKMKSHTILGAEVLLKYTDSIGFMSAVVAFEHHLKFDRSGYPRMAFPHTPFIASQIVSICDIYDAMSQKRNYKNDYPPNMIYELMIREKNTVFEPGLIDSFFRAVGVWPVGSIVLLSDKRTAVVREENEEDIFSPKVEIILPKGNKEIIDLKQAKDSIRIEKFLNPWKEGKELLSLI